MPLPVHRLSESPNCHLMLFARREPGCPRCLEKTRYGQPLSDLCIRVSQPCQDELSRNVNLEHLLYLVIALKHILLIQAYRIYPETIANPPSFIYLSAERRFVIDRIYVAKAAKLFVACFAGTLLMTTPTSQGLLLRSVYLHA